MLGKEYINYQLFFILFIFFRQQALDIAPAAIQPEEEKWPQALLSICNS